MRVTLISDPMAQRMPGRSPYYEALKTKLATQVDLSAKVMAAPWARTAETQSIVHNVGLSVVRSVRRHILTIDDLGYRAPRRLNNGDVRLQRLFQLREARLRGDIVVVPSEYGRTDLKSMDFRSRNIRVIPPGPPNWASPAAQRWLKQTQQQQLAPHQNPAVVAHSASGIQRLTRWNVLNRHAPQPKRELPAAPYIVVFANRGKWSNLLMAMEGLNYAAPDIPHHVVVVGDRVYAAAQYREYLQVLPNLKNRTQFWEQNEPIEMARLIAHADAAVATNIFDLGCSNVIGCLHLGTSVVIPASSSAEDFVTSGPASVTVDPTAAVGIEAGILELLARDPQERRANALAQAKNYSWDKTAQEYVSLYNEIGKA
ncbi:hypothetical protein [Trueperella sp. LYQ143]|uniref:hypothetical protein n=1 Tax=unclassified Trueperella TaxID=2630174 RepID=UPI0039838E2F